MTNLLRTASKVVRVSCVFLYAVVTLVGVLWVFPRDCSAGMTTTTTIPEIPELDETDLAPDSVPSDSRDTSALLPDHPAGHCSAYFSVEKKGDWFGLRFIAAYDRRKGTFGGAPDAVACKWIRYFESTVVENYYGVLQVSAVNDDSLKLFTGPFEMLVCDYEYFGEPPTEKDFTIQTQAAKTLVPIVAPDDMPTVSLTLNCVAR